MNKWHSHTLIRKTELAQDPFQENLILSLVCYVMEGNVLVIDYNIQQQNTIW